MGHLGHLKQEYRSLVERLGASTVGYPEPEDARAWQGWKEILEILFTPEEAEIASRLPVMPAGLEKVAARVGIPAAELELKLDAMCDKGLVMDLVSRRTGRRKYLLAPPVIGFFEFSLMRAQGQDAVPKRRMAEALEAYIGGDETFAREVAAGATTIGRALAHGDTLGDDPRPDVLSWERAEAIAADARQRAVSLCYCRHKAEHLGQACDAPMELCLSLNGGAEFVLRRGFGRPVERTEALELLARAREARLVHIADNVLDQPTYICNCCSCCCDQLRCINDYDLPAVTPSGFVPRTDEAQCSGCGRCARACPVTAIALQAVRADGTRRNALRPAIDDDRCLGCGLCVLACKKRVMTMRRRERQPRVPRNPVDKAIRMALERGRLADLVLDAGQGRGVRFLQSVVRTLTTLPLAQRLLASEQLQSRFVRVALGRTRDLI